MSTDSLEDTIARNDADAIAGAVETHGTWQRDENGTLHCQGCSWSTDADQAQAIAAHREHLVEMVSEASRKAIATTIRLDSLTEVEAGRLDAETMSDRMELSWIIVGEKAG